MNGDIYLQMLEQVVWPAVKGVVTRTKYVFQQDEATVHTTLAVRAFMEQKFGSRVISRLTATIRPVKSPDLSPLDFWFRGVADQEAKIFERVETGGVLKDLMDPEAIKRVTERVMDRSNVCLLSYGQMFIMRGKLFNGIQYSH